MERVSGTGRRLGVLLAAVAAIGTPAVVLRALCIGESCAENQPAAPVPFCSLPATMRDLLAAGFYEGRSPDALGVTGSTAVVTSEGGMRLRWPSVAEEATSMRVPLVFIGSSFVDRATPSNVTLDQIAPTLEPLLGLRRPHADIRSGRAIEGAVVPGAGPSRLIVEIVWRGVGSPDLERAQGETPFLRSSMGRGLVADATPGSLPLDPAAVLTTIGSGGLPRDHGITGTLIRSPDGRPVPAWSPAAPTSVIAELGDDLDRATDGDAKVGLVGTDPSDRGLIGGTWYPGRDDDEVMVGMGGGAPAAVAHVDDLLDQGWGRGGAPDLLAVVMRDSIENMDSASRDIVRDVEAAVPEAAFVLTATGSHRAAPEVVTSRELIAAVSAAVGIGGVIAAPTAGGLFIDQESALEAGIATQRIVDAMRALPDADGNESLFADAFPAFAVTFGTYC